MKLELEVTIREEYSIKVQKTFSIETDDLNDIDLTGAITRFVNRAVAKATGPKEVPAKLDEPLTPTGVVFDEPKLTTDSF